MTILKHSKSFISAGVSLIALATSTVMAAPAPAPVQRDLSPMMSGVYIGGFGGYGSSSNFEVNQSGVAFFTTAPLNTPLPVDASGDIDDLSIGFGGIHIGYEWLRPGCLSYKDMPSTWSITPAVELEGLYFKKTAEADVVSVNPRLGNHTFSDSFPTKTGVVLVNSIFTFNSAAMGMFHPYIGIGLGAAINSISDADSTQVNPVEAGVNHFNSDTNSADWTFAAQAKAGLRFVFNPHVRLFAEYRFLYLGNSDYTFGATRYPTHVETTSWVVNMDNVYYNTGVLGLEFSL